MDSGGGGGTGRAPACLLRAATSVLCILLLAGAAGKSLASENSSDTGALFSRPFLWDINEIAIVVAVIVIQSLLIAALLVQRRRRRRAEERLRQSEERISLTAESGNLGLWQLDLATSRIWATEQCRKILGVDADAELTQQSFIDACHPADRARALSVCQDAIGHGRSYEQEYRVLHRDGRVRWVLDRARNFSRTSPKSPRITGVIIDITERKEAEEALRQSEERYRNVVETQNELICRYLPDGTLTFVNDAYCRYFGRSRSDLIGRSFLEFLPEHEREGAMAYVRSLIEDSAGANYEHEVITQTSSQAWQQWRDRAIRNSEGQVVELQGVGRDITELKRAKREVRERRKEVTHLTRVASLGELSGALAHELNQPLTAILSNAQAAQRMLAQKVIDLPEVREILQDIVLDDNRASEVIRRLRVLFKKGDARLQPLDVNRVVSEVLELAHSELVTHHVTANHRMTADLPSVRADRIQLQQVLLNLVVNACEAMSATEPVARALEISTNRQEGGIVTIEIADRGSGLPRGFENRVFDSFYTTKADGLGLGLSISRSIIAAHGGRIWAHNNRDSGATFVVELPAAGGQW
jgi:PAS domain S-box-containing protein